MKLTASEREDFSDLMALPAFKYVLVLLDETVEKIERELLSVPITGKQEDAMLSLWSKRMEAQGAVSLRNALKKQLSDLRITKEGENK